VEKVITLRGNRDNPTEYANACPECNGLDSFTDIYRLIELGAKRLSVSTEIEVEWWLRKQKMSVADARYIIEQARPRTLTNAGKAGRRCCYDRHDDESPSPG
jgi:hypothetical protein